MKQSLLLTKTRKEMPADEDSLSARLLIRAGYIQKVMAGVYEFLPLGFKALNNVMRIIREEMDGIGGQEMLLSSLQNPDVWKKTERWGAEASDVWFFSDLVSGGEIGFGWTHEEPVTETMRHHIHSHRDLPRYLYQMQTKFRNEKRAKSGIMRTREFIMKDLYSLSRNEEEHMVFYEKCVDAYLRIFERAGIGDHTYRTFASGGVYSDGFSDEFQTLLPVGEDLIHIHKQRKIAVNTEIFNDETLEKLGVTADGFEEPRKAAEVGNTFTLGTRFSESIGLCYKNEEGKDIPVFMGSYGIGPARVLGVLTELFGKENELVLPRNIAPFLVHFISLATVPVPDYPTDSKEEALAQSAEHFHEELAKRCVPVLYDDRYAVSSGEKFAESDLLGIPYRIIMSERSREAGGVEFVDRSKGTTEILSEEACLARVERELSECATC